jgi:hypothetical protein
VNGRETALGIGGFAANYFGLGGLEAMQSMSLAMVPALSNPYFSLVPGASHAAVAQNFGGVKVKFGMLTSGFNQMVASQEGPYLPGASWNSLPKANSALVEMSKSFGDAAMTLSFSQTNEANAYLGSQSSGALSFAPNAVTSAVQIGGALLLMPKLALAGQASYGYTPGSVGTSSLISELTRTRTNAFSLALVASDRVKAGDRLSIAVSQPMRTYSGQMVMDVLAGVDSAGAQTRERMRFSMVPVGRELRAELNYHAPAGRDASAGITLLLRRDPNNMINISMEKLLALRYTKQF